MDIDLSEYTAGGYFITKYAQRDENRSPDLLPERLVSLSTHINGGMVSVYWGWDLDRHGDEAIAFGISAEKLPNFKEWSNRTHEIDIGHPDVFYSLHAARQFIKAFLPIRDELVLIGAALPNSLVDTFLKENKQWGHDTNGQKYDVLIGVNYVLSKRESPPPGGNILGFEVVSYNVNLGCSWLCGNLERKMHQEFGIRPGQYGLIETFEDANKVYDWILEGEAKGEHRGEPEPYYPWLIVRYSLA
jgi:hypothetical protein